MTFLDYPMIVTGVMAQRLSYTRKKTVFVPGRPYHSLTFRQEGRITIEYQDQKLVSSAGDLTFVPQDLSYNTQILEDGSIHILHFTTLDCPESLVPQRITPTCPAAFQAQFSELYNRFQIGKDQDAECLSLFYRILADVKVEYERQTNRAYRSPRMCQAKARMDQDYADSRLSVAVLAAELGISETYFRREFSAAFGTSPLAYLKKVRLENARLLLATGYCSVTETAMKCGFDSVSYFSYEFHRYTGVTPSGFIRRAEGGTEKG